MTAFATGLAEALGVGAGVGVTTTSASWVNLIRTIGDENVKFLAESVNQPFFSLRTVVETCAVPSADKTEIEADTGALENP